MWFITWPASKTWLFPSVCPQANRTCPICRADASEVQRDSEWPLEGARHSSTVCPTHSVLPAPHIEIHLRARTHKHTHMHQFFAFLYSTLSSFVVLPLILFKFHSPWDFPSFSALFPVSLFFLRFVFLVHVHTRRSSHFSVNDPPSSSGVYVCVHMQHNCASVVWSVLECARVCVCVCVADFLAVLEHAWVSVVYQTRKTSESDWLDFLFVRWCTVCLYAYCPYVC